MRITFIGGGNMARALIGGLLARNIPPGNLQVVDPDDDKRASLARDYGVTTLASVSPAALEADLLILAVKPQQLAGVAKSLQGRLVSPLVVSIAAGIRAGDLSRWLGGYPRIVRVMPNTPAMIGAGISGLFALPAVSAEDKARAAMALAAVGGTVWVDDETQLDAVTAVSGSGPAYVFYFIEALEAAAAGLGLDAASSRRLALETFLGAAKLATASVEDAASLRAKVTSKGGTTERALQVMEQAGIKQAIIAAVGAAAERAKALGDELGQAG
ncbi:MAG: pyrroline-5-carboxylate reductase [Betaproteobacteria bacterium]|nr:pyrroline-5-carboxylate reductase [Betaproteobacteria bacterium]